MMTMNKDEVKLIFKYTREQALADGVLVDVTPLAREAGLRYPAAITAELMRVLTPREADGRRGQSLAGRQWDCLWMLAQAIRGWIPSKKCAGPGSGETVYYRFLLMERGIRGYREIKAVCGPGDDHHPVLTLMLPDED